LSPFLLPFTVAHEADFKILGTTETTLKNPFRLAKEKAIGYTLFIGGTPACDLCLFPAANGKSLRARSSGSWPGFWFWAFIMGAFLNPTSYEPTTSSAG
jgi:hypothetical protein